MSTNRFKSCTSFINRSYNCDTALHRKISSDRKAVVRLFLFLGFDERPNERGKREPTRGCSDLSTALSGGSGTFFQSA